MKPSFPSPTKAPHFFLAFVLAATLPVLARSASSPPPEAENATSLIPLPNLERHFQSPPASARPWVLWMWLRADTTPEAITADLEEMRAKGIEGAILYDTGVGGELTYAGSTIKLHGKEYRKVPTSAFPDAKVTPLPTRLLEPWDARTRELIRFASLEAARLGVKLVLSVGLASTSGPIEPKYGQQKLVWSETGATGPTRYDGLLPVPDHDVPTINQSAKHPEIPPKQEGAPSEGTPVAVLAVPDREIVSPTEVVDLSSKMDAGGRLRWEVPAGKWKILRFAFQPTGKRNIWGLFTDGMSAEALDKTWDVTIGRVLEEMSPEERKGLFGIEDDSWEADLTTWTRLFPQGFREFRQYDLIPWLPVLAGKTIGGPSESEGVRRDYHRTIADLIAKNHYARLGELSRKNGLVSFSEAAGPNTAQLDYALNFKGIDVPMGEFWVASPHRPTPARRFLLRNAASASHVLGKRMTACEAFTSIGPHWEDTFFGMKNSADQAFADGCNLMVIHCFSHSPSLTARPGYVYFAGTHYNRGTTWWDQTPAFNDYLARCSLLLQQGVFVADALCYRGDAIGHGEPMKTQPALPAAGYDHDNCNLNTLLTRVNTKDGLLVLPDGMTYRFLVFPDDSPMAPEALQRIAQLLEEGATVIGPKPRGPVGRISLEAQSQFATLADRLWKENPGLNRIGSGELFAQIPPSEALQSLKIPPDFQYTGLSENGQIDWIHRKAEGLDIYFVASLWDPPEKIEATFRISGKLPELWNPVTGEIREAVAFRQDNGLTTVPLDLNPRESVFVVFRKPISPQASGSASSNTRSFQDSAGISGSWDVSFDPKSGGPGKVDFASLEDWTNHSDEGIRHYSGTAIYRKTITLPPMRRGEKLWLNLGEVREVASVRLNKKDLGVVWTKPARVDISQAARTGENELEIAVVNLWPNRLIGDAKLPAEKRITATNMNKFGAATPLYPSGLLGPVRIETSGP